MVQRLEIKNFGPLREINLDISDYMVFVGPNAAGKSTIAKLFYCFRSLPFPYRDLIADYNNLFVEGIYEFVEKIIRNHFRLFWDIEALQDDFTVRFYPNYNEKDSEHSFISLKKSSTNLSIKWSKRFRDVIDKKISKYLEKVTSKGKERLSKMFRLEIFLIIYRYFNSDHEHCFIPAGRQILSLPTDNMPLFNEGRFDYLTGNFMRFVKEKTTTFNIYIDEFKEQKIKKIVRDNHESLEIACRLIDKILKGKYISTREGERIYLNEKQFVKLYEASSGQQEVLWILNIILLLIPTKETSSKDKNLTVIEEPEAHLFPETQHDITNLISLLANRKNQQVIVTTHSPYILVALNNLLYAHKLGKDHPKETAEKINPLLWVDGNRLAVYIVENGTCRNIIDPELEMISTEEIDHVSQIINGEFDSLFDLKYS
ncbi:MAG: ATP-binding protein [Planctomycetaceae bacterium]|jgi:AAA15 family ATPase/GTPase|nr:ATP-binding protein [Planctomycetaceae bacterium]